MTHCDDVIISLPDESTQAYHRRISLDHENEVQLVFDFDCHVLMHR